MKKVLIIDDAATVRMYHQALLKEIGLEVDQAENGMAALEKVAKSDYDLMLVDINMPMLDGYAFLKELRRQGTRGSAPAIMISTEADAEDRRRALRAGANYYLVKPVAPNVLQSHVELILGEST